MRRAAALAVLFALAPLLRPQSPAGEWQGAIEAPGAPLQVVVRLVEAAAGRLSGTIDIPAQQARDLPLGDFAWQAPKLAFAIQDVPGAPAFAGELSADGSRLAGTFTQGGQSMPFALLRAAAAAAAAAAAFDGFQAWLDETRALFLVPGCAIAVVKGGELLATFPSGRRDVAHDLPVTADTLFAIGSSTKAFTTFGLATLVAKGELDWDAPLRRWLPEFALSDAPLGERITPRDLVTHRSGMPRHDLVWYGATFERAEMVRRLRHLPLNHDLRTDFQYNNLMFLCAGHLAERITGTSWEAHVRSAILQPLGMARTVFTVAEVQRDADHAEPYRKDGKVVAPIPFRDITAIGPAGSINSSAREMARWVALHLQGGELDGTRLLPAAAVEDLHRVRMPMGPRPRPTPEVLDVGYALGWMVDVYRGHRRVHHGGNIDGFSAMVTLLPDRGIGFVALTNLDGTALAEVAVRNLCDRALGLPPHDWRSEILLRTEKAEGMEQKGKEAAAGERKTGTAPAHPLAEYAGDYLHPGYGPCHVELQDGALHIDFHGVGAPMRHWHYEVFSLDKNPANPELEGMKVQFGSDFEGEIDGLRAPLEPNTGPIVFARQPDRRLCDPAFLQQLAGDYDLGTTVASFTVQGSVLVAMLGGERYELAPKRGLVFDLKELSGYSVRFVADAQGNVGAVRVRQPEGVFEANRKAH